MNYIIGAYATAPIINSNRLLEDTFYEKLLESIKNIRGFEIPFYGDDIHRFGYNYLLNFIKPSWDNVISCIPGTMESLSKNPHFGLASDDIIGRRQAIDMMNRVNLIIKKINEFYGRKSIFAVQIVTAPSKPVSGVSSSQESLLRSMEEVLSMDWQGAKIVIEHADKSNNGESFEKGFLSLECEIKTLIKLKDLHNVGITINWARSAIEGKNLEKPLEHIKLAIEYNLLSGLIFSGVSMVDRNYGSWKDTHMPFSKSYNVKHYEKNSLLNHENIKKTLNLLDINNLDYLGIKINAIPLSEINIERRVGLNKDAVYILDNILKELN
jgi:hypothetical protein